MHLQGSLSTVGRRSPDTKLAGDLETALEQSLGSHRSTGLLYIGHVEE